MQLVGLRQLPQVFVRALIGLALLLALAAALLLLPERAWGQSLDKPTFVVALDKLDRDQFYARTVMIAAPRGGGGHIGLILNKPSPYTMAKLFPGEEAVKAVSDPVYIGGPERSDAIVAVTKAEASPGDNSLQLMPGFWLVLQGAVIDALLEKTPNAARYYMGFVIWKPGELAEEIRKGWVMLCPADPAKLFLPDTSKLYDDLVTPSRKPAVET